MRSFHLVLGLSSSLVATTAASADGVGCTCTGDFDGNGVIDGADLGILLTGWGPCGPPANDLCGNAQSLPIGAMPISVPFCTLTATTSGPAFPLGDCDNATNAFKDVWFQFVLSVYRSTIDGGCTGLLVECNDDTNSPACELPGQFYKSRVSFFSDAGTQYYIQVTGWNGAKGHFGLDIAQDCP